jgi:hypothetical protein
VTLLILLLAGLTLVLASRRPADQATLILISSASDHQQSPAAIDGPVL